MQAISNVHIPNFELPDDFDYIDIPQSQFEYVESSTVMNNLFNVTLSTVAVGGVLATICSNSEKDPKYKEKSPKTNKKKDPKNQNQRKCLPQSENDFNDQDTMLNHLGLSRSKTQHNTKGDGNCLFHCVYDQVYSKYL